MTTVSVRNRTELGSDKPDLIASLTACLKLIPRSRMRFLTRASVSASNVIVVRIS
jgi:hypothetical protein